MSLRVYNTLSKQKELFEPVRPGKVGVYLCGPTVYKPPHIGHLVGPVIFDAIDRFPKASEHMEEIVALIQQLIEKNFAYAAEGNVWFDVTKDEDYGKLSN